MLLEKQIVTQRVKKFPVFYAKPEVHCCVKKNSPLVPILSQIHPVCKFPADFSNVNSNIIFTSTPLFRVVSFLQIFKLKYYSAYLISILGYIATGLLVEFSKHSRKSKVKFSLCLTKHYVMKTYWDEGIAPRILELGTRIR